MISFPFPVSTLPLTFPPSIETEMRPFKRKIRRRCLLSGNTSPLIDKATPATPATPSCIHFLPVTAIHFDISIRADYLSTCLASITLGNWENMATLPSLASQLLSNWFLIKYDNSALGNYSLLVAFHSNWLVEIFENLATSQFPLFEFRCCDQSKMWQQRFW